MRIQNGALVFQKIMGKFLIDDIKQCVCVFIHKAAANLIN